MTITPGNDPVYKIQTAPAVDEIQPPTLGVGGLVGENIATVTEIGLGVTIPKTVDTPPKPTPDRPTTTPGTTPTGPIQPPVTPPVTPPIQPPVQPPVQPPPVYTGPSTAPGVIVGQPIYVPS